MKRIFLVIFSCLFLLTGCGNKELDFDSVYKNLENEYKGFVEVSDSSLEGVYGVDLGEFESYLVVMSEDNATSKMYAIFEAKDSIDDALYEAQYFVDNYVKSWGNNYFPQEEKLVKDGVLETYGNYIIYIVNEDTDKILKLIKKN